MEKETNIRVYDTFGAEVPEGHPNAAWRLNPADEAAKAQLKSMRAAAAKIVRPQESNDG